MQLCSQLFVLWRELAHPVLRDPVIPAIIPHLVSRDVLDFVLIFFSQRTSHCFDTLGNLFKDKNGQHGIFSWGEGRKFDDLKKKFWVAALSNFGRNDHLIGKV
jgi:hypothetical protein